MLRKEKSPLQGLKWTAAGTPRRSGRHQTCRAPGAGCSSKGRGTGRGLTLHWVPLELKPGTSTRTQKVKFQGELHRIRMAQAVVCAQSLRRVWLLQPHGLWPASLLCPWGSPGKNTGGGCHALLQGIFPTQGSNPHLLHCGRILCHLSHQGIARWAPHKHNYLHSSALWTRQYYG